MAKLKQIIKSPVRWFKNLSIKKSYTAYMIIALIISSLIGLLVMFVLSEVRNYMYIFSEYKIEYTQTVTSYRKILKNETLNIVEYDDEVSYQVVDVESGNGIHFPVFKNGSTEVEILKNKNNEIKGLIYREFIKVEISIVDIIMGFLIISSVPIFLFLGCIICSLLFFKYKLNPPIKVLMKASKKISNNELDFEITYKNKDEMGLLCDSFEMMRHALYENQKELWRNIEERKRLNSAFSHDLRTPLTVLKGYSEMLLMGLESETATKENMIQTVTTMTNNINRLERYTYEMSRMQKLEDITINKKPISSQFLLNQVKEAGEILGGDLNFYMMSNLKDRMLNIDFEIVMQVYENLMANSKRYAQHKICVNCNLINEQLMIEVIDDGKGFTAEGLEKAMNPFYKEQENVNNAHFGLGLHICRLLTEKHGGDLKIANQSGMGAKITANFGKII